MCFDHCRLLEHALGMKPCLEHEDAKDSLSEYWYNMDNIPAYKIANPQIWKQSGIGLRVCLDFQIGQINIKAFGSRGRYPRMKGNMSWSQAPGQLRKGAEGEIGRGGSF